MKIIDKSKDFYDGLNPDYDADIIYVRKPTVIRDKNIVSSCYKAISTAFEAEYGRNWGRNHYVTRYHNLDHDTINTFNVIFGIYPKVYTTPIISIHRKNYLMPNSLLDKLSKADKKDVDSLIIRHVIVDRKVLPDESRKFKTCIEHSFPKSIECKEAFNILSAPVFVYLGSDTEAILGESSMYNQLLDFRDKNVILTNICFNKLNVNLIGPFADELVTLNTPINIENFLWSSKQEPMSEPDNKTKIVSHGFDLKTSFRKM